MMFFTSREIVMDLRTSAISPHARGKIKNVAAPKPSNSVLRLQFVNANKNPIVTGEEKLTSKSNYFIGNDPNKWHKDIPNYAKLNYKNLYPGIDMIFYNNQNLLEYDIRVAPGVDPHKAKFNIVGAKNVSINPQGDLTLLADNDEKIMMHKPVVYQTINGVKKPITGDFVLTNNKQISFKVGPYDKSQTLIIDPAIAFSTYLGGSGGDNAALAIQINAKSVAPDLYLTGYTTTTDFPTVNPYQATNKNGGKGRTVFVTRINRLTRAIVYSTYLGGSGGNDEGFAIALDSVNAAYVTGETNSKDFPTVNPFQATNNGAKYFSAFVAKINPEGNALIYSSYLGGTGDNQEGNAIIVDEQGFAYVAGETDSFDFPTKNPFQATNNAKPRPAPYSPFTAYITKFNTTGNGLVFSTYLGGSGGQDEINGIGIDIDKNIFVTGETNSKDFPIKNPIQATPKPTGAAQTGFVTSMTPDGSALRWSTYWGGSGGNDYPTSLKIGSSQNVYIGGYTNSEDFPVIEPAVQSTNRAAGKKPGFNGFITKFSNSGAVVIYSTYLGGSGGDDRILGLDINIVREPHVIGMTNSHDFPLLNQVQSTNKGSGTTAFEAGFLSAGTLLESTYLGGSGGRDIAYGIAVDNLANSYIVGQTNSSDFPLVFPIQSTLLSPNMAFFTQITV